MTDDLNHSCRSDQACVARTSTGPAVTTKPDTLCHPCCSRLQEQLDQLPTIVEVLRLYLVRGGSSAQTKVKTGKGEPPPPMNVGTLDLIDEIEDVLDRAAGLSVSDLIRQPAAQFILWIRGKKQMDFLDGVQRALHIRAVWKKADGVIGLSTPWQQRHAPCPECNLRCLGNYAGGNAIQCSNCGHTMTLDEYDEQCKISAKKK